MKTIYRKYPQPLIAATLLSAGLLAGCSRRDEPAASTTITGESCVMAKELPTTLLFDSIQKGITVRNAYKKDVATTVYEEGKDYVVDYAKGTIRRTADSRIPDYSCHVMYGQHNFDDSKYGDFSVWSNKPYFVFIDYSSPAYKPLADDNDQSSALTHLAAKLKGGRKVKIAWYGDSITAGREATQPELSFTHRYEQFLKNKYPQADIQSTDVSIIGYSSKEGREWFEGKFKDLSPDVVFIGFGMNDHNKIGIEPDAFRANLDSIAGMVRQKSGADVVFFSAFPPNDEWYQSTHRMDQFAAATRQAAADTHSAYIDVYGTWMKVLKRKDQCSMLSNNVNHPNDFGHWLYEQAFEAMHF